MEVWHWAKTEVDYAATTYWYGRPGAKAVPMASEARRHVTYHHQMNLPGFKLFKRPPGTVEIQDLRTFGVNKWKDNNQLWWQRAKPGAELTLLVPVGKTGRYAVVMNMTQAPDYAQVQFYVDGKKAGEPVDFYSANVSPAEPVKLGPFRLKKGEHRVTIKIVGANAKAQKAYMVGIDHVELKRVK
jgi:hypothetical protein